jgi:hypothetical protein
MTSNKKLVKYIVIDYIEKYNFGMDLDHIEKYNFDMDHVNLIWTLCSRWFLGKFGKSETQGASGTG